jgi:hypothetical protein
MIANASSRIDDLQYVVDVIVFIISTIQTLAEVTTVGHLLPSGFNRAVHICGDQQACDERNQETLCKHCKTEWGESVCGCSCWIIHVEEHGLDDYAAFGAVAAEIIAGTYRINFHVNNLLSRPFTVEYILRQSCCRYFCQLAEVGAQTSNCNFLEQLFANYCLRCCALDQ